MMPHAVKWKAGSVSMGTCTLVQAAARVSAVRCVSVRARPASLRRRDRADAGVRWRPFARPPR